MALQKSRPIPYVPVCTCVAAQQSVQGCILLDLGGIIAQDFHQSCHLLQECIAAAQQQEISPAPETSKERCFVQWTSSFSNQHASRFLRVSERTVRALSIFERFVFLPQKGMTVTPLGMCCAFGSSALKKLQSGSEQRSRKCR